MLKAGTVAGDALGKLRKITVCYGFFELAVIELFSLSV